MLLVVWGVAVMVGFYEGMRGGSRGFGMSLG